MFRFPRAVWLLGCVSLATDSATEAIYPILPFFLTRVLGAGAVSLGIVEGAAEAVNSILKIWSGRAADRAKTKRPLVLFGYSVSSVARPLISITTSWVQVFAVRVLDVHDRLDDLHPGQLDRRVPAPQADRRRWVRAVRSADVGRAPYRQGGDVGSWRRLVGPGRPARRDRPRLDGVRGRLCGICRI